MTDRRGVLAGLGGLAGVAAMPALIGASPAPPRPHREVLAFYYGWYGNPARSGRYLHWQGPGKTIAPQQSPTFDTPLLGEYDSHDPAVIERHVAWARQAGITVLISSWWGAGSFEDRSLALLLDAAHAQGLRVGVYLERQKAGEAGARSEIAYLLNQYGHHPALFRVGDRPVFFLFLQALRDLPAAGWRRAAKSAAGSGLPEPMLIGDASPRETTDFATWAPFLDGIHVYVLAPYVTGMKPAQMREWATKTYPLWKAKIRPRIWCATVIPGFDDTLVPGRPGPRPTVPRYGGATFQTLWQVTIDAAPDWVIVTSFNEWHEGSEIEPSKEYGTTYIAANRGYATRFLQG